MPKNIGPDSFTVIFTTR